VRSKEAVDCATPSCRARGWQWRLGLSTRSNYGSSRHLSQDLGLTGGVRVHEDVHRTSRPRSSRRAGRRDERTTEQARPSPTVSPTALEAFDWSRRLACPLSVAKESWTSISAGFPSLRAYMDQRSGHSREGLLAHRVRAHRPFPDIATATGPQRPAAERQRELGHQASRPTSLSPRSVRAGPSVARRGSAGATHPPGPR